MSKFQSQNSNKLGVHLSKSRFMLKNIQKNVDAIKIQIAKDKGIDLSNEIIEIEEPLIKQIDEVIKESEELYLILEEKEKYLIKGDLKISSNLLNATLFNCASIKLDIGIYLIVGQVCVSCKKTGLLSYVQTGLSNSDEQINKTSYDSNVINTSVEQGYNVINNLSHLVEITEPKIINLWVKSSFLSGAFSYDESNSKLQAIKF